MLNEKKLAARLENIVEASKTARSFKEVENIVGLTERVIRYTLFFSIKDEKIVLENFTRNKKQERLQRIREESKTAQSYTGLCEKAEISYDSLMELLKEFPEIQLELEEAFSLNKHETELKDLENIVKASEGVIYYYQIERIVGMQRMKIYEILKKYPESKKQVERNLSLNKEMKKQEEDRQNIEALQKIVEASKFAASYKDISLDLGYSVIYIRNILSKFKLHRRKVKRNLETNQMLFLIEEMLNVSKRVCSMEKIQEELEISKTMMDKCFSLFSKEREQIKQNLKKNRQLKK